MGSSTTRHRNSSGLVLALAVLLALVATAWGIVGYMNERPDTFTFRPARQRIPGELVRSENVTLTGFRGPIVARVGGQAEAIYLNGKPAGTRVKVAPGDRLAIAVRAPSLYDDTAIGLLSIGTRVVPFRVASIRRPPPDRLTPDDVAVAPGRTALSTVVAPTGFAPGSQLRIEGAQVQVETREGRFDPPVPLVPGQPFRLVTRVPKSGSGPLEIGLTLGTLNGTWRIRSP